MPLPSMELRGGAALLFDSTDAEVMLAGPAETGKTMGGLHKLDTLLRRYAGAQATIVRKVRASMDGTVLASYRRLIDQRGGVVPYGGNKPEWYDYANGSRLWVAGLDNPGKALSSERDVIYVNQAEELALDDWQTLTTRATGRGAVVPYPQVFGDCNPGPAHHWIKHRPSLRLLESRHEDNPALFTPDGTPTEQGIRSLAVLDALQGVLKERLRYGRWVSAEGAVYAFDARLHLIDPLLIPSHWRKIRAIDFGYTNPFVCLWLAIDGDGRIIVYRELYMSGRTVKRHAEMINALSAGEAYEATVADHDAEDRATLEENGIATIPASKAISPGIQAVEERLKVAGDGKPRLFIVKNALVERDDVLAAKYQPYSTEQEFDAYIWPKSADNKTIKETPVDAYNHGLDALRYGVMYVDGGVGGWSADDLATVSKGRRV